jgi:hypothetical protein
MSILLPEIGTKSHNRTALRSLRISSNTGIPCNSTSAFSVDNANPIHSNPENCDSIKMQHLTIHVWTVPPPHPQSPSPCFCECRAARRPRQISEPAEFMLLQSFLSSTSCFVFSTFKRSNANGDASRSSISVL